MFGRAVSAPRSLRNSSGSDVSAQHSFTMNTNITDRMYKERAKTREKSETEEIAELMSLGIHHPARKRHREREERRQVILPDAERRFEEHRFKKETSHRRPNDLCNGAAQSPRAARP